MRWKLGLVLLFGPLGGCIPTMEMRDGQDRDRLIQIVRQFCAAERSAANDTAAVFAEPVRHMLQSLPAKDLEGRPRYVTSVDPMLSCAPGRTWYLGGSRMFAEVRLQGGSDRLDLWRSDASLIRNVLYHRRRQVGARGARHLQEALMSEIAVPGRAERSAVSPTSGEAHRCLATLENGSAIKSFRNVCNFAVSFSYCAGDRNCPDKIIQIFLAPHGLSASGFRGEAHWFACRHPARPAGVSYVRGRGLLGHCRRDPAAVATAQSEVSANEPAARR